MDSDLQGFPTFQWSVFPHGKDGEQFVVRGSNFEKFILDIEAVKFQFSKLAQFLETPANSFAISGRTLQPPIAPENPKKVCSSCGSEMEFRSGKSKKLDEDTGEPYDWKGYFCTKKCGAEPQWIK